MNEAMDMAEAPSYHYQNKEYLLEVIMNQLGITRDDLEMISQLLVRQK